MRKRLHLGFVPFRSGTQDRGGSLYLRVMVLDFYFFIPHIACIGDLRAPDYLILILYVCCYRSADPWRPFDFIVHFLGKQACDHGK